jgi:hypothetical protein
LKKEKMVKGIKNAKELFKLAGCRGRSKGGDGGGCVMTKIRPVWGVWQVVFS